MTPGVHLGQRPELRHDPGQEQDRQVRLVLADARVALRRDLVAGRGEAHDARRGGRCPVAVDVAAGQDERVLGLEARRARPARAPTAPASGPSSRAVIVSASP